ncbi:preprotein translocase subunit SecG [Patescibacteria group bacterium]|nr:preprotein translocase subunit SecG [Patescibacteria group bacterium]
MILIIQSIIAIALIVLILLQERSSGLSGIFGGESGGGVYQTRRGMEKIIFWATIVLIVILLALSIYQLVV